MERKRPPLVNLTDLDEEKGQGSVPKPQVLLPTLATLKLDFSLPSLGPGLSPPSTPPFCLCPSI